MGGIVDLDNSHLLPVGTTRAMVLESNNRALLERIGQLERRNGELDLALKAAQRDIADMKKKSSEDIDRWRRSREDMGKDG